MSRLRNRIRKADYFTDGELLRWHRDKRQTYTGLWAIAEDSGCLEDDPFAWKVAIWSSPLDADITVEVLERWRDELVEAGKLIPYEADGKRYLYIRTFHQHEHPRNPQRPDLPMPEWLVCESVQGVGKDGRGWVRTSYRDTKHVVQGVYETCTSPAQDAPPRPAPSRVPKGTYGRAGSSKRPVDNSTVRPLAEEKGGGNGHAPLTCIVCGKEITTPPVEMPEGLRHKDCSPRKAAQP